MNEYIIVVEYFPSVMGKDKLVKVKSDKSVDVILKELQKLEKAKNPMYEVDLYLFDKEEFFNKLEEVSI